MLSLVCIAIEVFFFLLGECMLSARGQSALSRQRGQGFCILLEQKENSSYKL
ncbi:unnamed protein product [Staurois parvus]|uniref:Uncharacterized protein n=1 Tax=Staurois parvus TaxID=386267 RepID=A0ABN9A7M9_9NEOB|nr:unnamed protein product [Staurois parvus]